MIFVLMVVLAEGGWCRVAPSPVDT